MHADELHSDVDLVRALLTEQHPRWAQEAITIGSAQGTENRIYRLGEGRCVRLPRRPAAALRVEKEHRWLPRLAPRLALATPVPLALGRPSSRFPWPWSVRPWLPGQEAGAGLLDDHGQAARDLARDLLALREQAPDPELLPGEHNFWRGEPLVERDAAFRAALQQLEGDLDPAPVADLWERALAAPPWTDPPVWIHGDLSPRNLLVNEGRLSAVLDFGGLGLGDPACDLIVAWNLFDPAGRGALREALAVDDDTWTRGMGWAVSVAVIALPYYRDTNAALVAEAEHVLGALGVA